MTKQNEPGLIIERVWKLDVPDALNDLFLLEAKSPGQSKPRPADPWGKSPPHPSPPSEPIEKHGFPGISPWDKISTLVVRPHPGVPLKDAALTSVRARLAEAEPLASIIVHTGFLPHPSLVVDVGRELSDIAPGVAIGF